MKYAIKPWDGCCINCDKQEFDEMTNATCKMLECRNCGCHFKVKEKSDGSKFVIAPKIMFPKEKEVIE
jgi:hypothetical protein